jgi:hypothetical protein
VVSRVVFTLLVRWWKYSLLRLLQRFVQTKPLLLHRTNFFIPRAELMVLVVFHLQGQRKHTDKWVPLSHCRSLGYN